MPSCMIDRKLSKLLTVWARLMGTLQKIRARLYLGDIARFGTGGDAKKPHSIRNEQAHGKRLRRFSIFQRKRRGKNRPKRGKKENGLWPSPKTVTHVSERLLLCLRPMPEYRSTQMGARYPLVMPAKHVPASFRRGAGIRAFLLDSRQKHAGMTPGDNGHSILYKGTKFCAAAREVSGELQGTSKQGRVLRPISHLYPSS